MSGRAKSIRRLLNTVAVIATSLGALSGARAHFGENKFQRYVDELPRLPRIKVDRSSPSNLVITLSQFNSKIHRDIPETPVWGYNGSAPGPVIEVEEGKALTIHWKNELPATHIFPIPRDGLQSMAGRESTCNVPDVRSVTHVHGAPVEQRSTTDQTNNSDGWPDLWTLPGQEQVSHYPNDQTARLLWYHDHAMGETGRNVAAGLVGMYIIRDDYERSLNLPAGDYEIPLLLQAQGINLNGARFYSHQLSNEFYGNSVAVNGKLWPVLTVEPRKYRFRMVDASNARSYGLKLVIAGSEAPGPAFYQIGSDGGFLQDTTVLNDPSDPMAPRLVLSPGERADVIIDFSKFAGKTLTLNNDSIDPGDGEIAVNELMQVKVLATSPATDPSQLPMHMRPIERIDLSQSSVDRKIVLGQSQINGATMLTLNDKLWHDPVTERATLGSIEVWELVNTLPDSHPFHVHLVNFQILDRTPYDVPQYLSSGKIVYTGTPQLPDPNEMGWKDVVKAPPGFITRIIMKFEPLPPHTDGHYVYHCHILEHEDMDMMRPFDVVSQ